MKINNAVVFGLENAFRVSKFPFSTDLTKATCEYTDTIKKLGTSRKGEGHDNFLNGIIVQFELTFSNKAWVELERYHFIDFISSQSTIHCIAKMDIKHCCNEYVSQNVIEEVIRLKYEYLDCPTEDNYLKLLYNVPSGFELTAGMTTNYRQLKTIYSQRKNHSLPEWRNFCKWIETLPNSELITGDIKNE